MPENMEPGPEEMESPERTEKLLFVKNVVLERLGTPREGEEKENDAVAEKYAKDVVDRADGLGIEIPESMPEFEQRSNESIVYNEAIRQMGEAGLELTIDGVNEAIRLAEEDYRRMFDREPEVEFDDIVANAILIRKLITNRTDEGWDKSDWISIPKSEDGVDVAEGESAPNAEFAENLVVLLEEMREVLQDASVEEILDAIVGMGMEIPEDSSIAKAIIKTFTEHTKGIPLSGIADNLLWDNEPRFKGQPTEKILEGLVELGMDISTSPQECDPDVLRRIRKFKEFDDQPVSRFTYDDTHRIAVKLLDEGGLEKYDAIDYSAVVEIFAENGIELKDEWPDCNTGEKTHINALMHRIASYNKDWHVDRNYEHPKGPSVSKA